VIKVFLCLRQKKLFGLNLWKKKKIYAIRKQKTPSYIDFVNSFDKNNTLRNGNNQYNRNNSTLCLMLFCFLNVVDVFQTKKQNHTNCSHLSQIDVKRERESPLKTFAFSAFFS
jgi:hypothetical protein